MISMTRCSYAFNLLSVDVPCTFVPRCILSIAQTSCIVKFHLISYTFSVLPRGGRCFVVSLELLLTTHP